MRLPLSRPAGGRNGDRAVQSYMQAVISRGRTPWRQARWCALDFEMTGLNPTEDEIISFGAVPIEGGRLQLRSAVTGLVRPSRQISEASIPVHGIRDVDLVAAPPLAAAIDPLIGAIAGRVLVFHSAAIDRPFLRQALRHKGMRLRNPFVDTEVLGRLWLYERDGRLHRRLPLADLASAIQLPAERPHDSLGDALTTAQVFIALATHLDAMRPETVSTLVHASTRVDAVRTFQDPLRHDG